MPCKQIFEIIKHHWKDRKFVIHECSQCEYKCGFFWDDNQLYYNSGCYCLVEREKPRLCSDDELMKYIKENREIIDELFEAEGIKIT